MGVRFNVKNRDVSIPYSYLQKLRYKFIQAAIKHLTKQRKVSKNIDADITAVRQQLVKVLKKIIAKPNEINYDYFYIWDSPLQSNLILLDLAGLYVFVMHSDHDGAFSLGNIVDMLSNMKNLKLAQIDPVFAELERLFLYALSTHSIVTLS